ncbi:MAG: prepilin-type N-terminal cleavage/methylation domain-containing protein [Planctomycetes bacterium]|nr:prepilin-type N-terminal cleavage/methylation domain-containing protein [Planctomycetota bacterium]
MRKGFTLIELMIVIAIIAIIAAIAIPNLLESRVTANESASSASLKSGIFAGQVQFQGGGYLDRDQDNVGEYGTIKMLAGINATNKVTVGNLRLLTGPLANSSAWSTGTTDNLARGSANGFFFTAVAPSETGTDEASDEYFHDGMATGAATAAFAATDSTANNGEQSWAAAAVPQEWGNAGRRVFFIGNDGQVRSPAVAAVQDAVFNSTATAPGANGLRPATDALARAIATGMATAAVTNAAGVLSIATTSLDAATPTGYPIYSK